MNTRNNKTRVLSFVTLVIASALAFAYVRRPSSSGNESARRDGAAADSGNATADTNQRADGTSASNDAHACRFEAGKTLSYALNIASTSTLPAAMLGQDPKGAPVTLPSSTTVALDLKALSGTDGKSTVLLAHYHDVHSNVLDNGAANLAAPFLLKVAESCEITGFARLASTNKAYARTQQSIAHELMFTWPAKDSAEFHSENAYGPYVARASITMPGARASVKREVLAYDTYWDEERGGPQRLELVPQASSTSVSLDKGPWFERLEGHERVAGRNTAFDNHVVATRTEAAADAFDKLSHDVSAYVWEDLLPQQFKLRAPRPVTGKDLEARELVKTFTPRQSVDRFMKRFTDKVAFQETWPELTTYLEARPEETDNVVDLLKTGVVSQEAAPAFYVALGRARTQESLAVLHDIMQSEGSPLPERIRASFAMIDRDDVGISLAQEFAVHADGIDDKGSKIKRVFGREVALAMGALAGLHEDDEAMKQVVMETAKSILAKSKDPVLVRPAFGALANMGDLRALPIADEAFAHGTPKMRAVAAVVVRRMSPRDTSDTVARWLAAENDWNVKRSIYSVVSRQMADIALPASPALIAQAAKDLQTDPGNITRKAIIRVLGLSVNDSPEARAALIARVPFELKKKTASMYSVIAGYLTPEETREAIANAL